MRSADAYLLDIVEAADRIAAYILGMTQSDFLRDPKTKAAVVREVEIMGEAARHVPEAKRAAHPSVPWAELARLRNFYIHVYHGLDYELVWRTATGTVPRVASAVSTLVPPAEPEPEP